MMEIKDIPIDDIETALAGCSGAVHTGSLSSELAPPITGGILSDTARYSCLYDGRIEQDGFAKQNANLPADGWQVRVRAGASGGRSSPP